MSDSDTLANVSQRLRKVSAIILKDAEFLERVIDALTVDDSATAKPDLPPTLLKATQDHWQYLLEMKNGQQFIFSEAELVNTEWIHLKQLDEGDTIEGACFDGPLKDNPYAVTERGLCVRLDSIAWVADGIS